ncbi:MAG: RsbRD N-terminal domain-containing protein [Gemmatimonadetes bacterium]|nr:RsbRD N-terminal domain-containing protein [Gemmatimonadota bacterium]
MTFGDLLEERKDTVVERWVEAVLAAYPSDSAALFRAQQDPFANPLGHNVREGTRGILRAMLDEMDPERLRTHLDQIIRIRAVQDLTPSQALSFVFSLRSIVREVIPEAIAGGKHHDDLAAFDERIDRVALHAFELYSAMREELADLRVKEVKRQVAFVLDRMNRSGGGTEEVSEDSSKETTTYETVHREDL